MWEMMGPPRQRGSGQNRRRHQNHLRDQDHQHHHHRHHFTVITTPDFIIKTIALRSYMR